MSSMSPSDECVQIRELVSEGFDVELNELDSARVAAHTRLCPDCARHVSELRAIVAAMRHAPLERPERGIRITRRARAGRLGEGAAAAAFVAVTTAIEPRSAQPAAAARATAELAVHHRQVEERLVAMLAGLNAAPIDRAGRVIAV